MSFVKHSSHYDTAKALLSFLVVVVAFSILILFVTYSNNILANSQQYYLFMTLTVVGFGLMLGLIYLVSKGSGTKAKVKAAAKSSTKSAKKKRK